MTYWRNVYVHHDGEQWIGAGKYRTRRDAQRYADAIVSLGARLAYRIKVTLRT